MADPTVLVIEDERQIRRFLQFLIADRRVPDDVPQKWSGHAYLLYGSTARRVRSDSAVLVGDAAGMAYAQSGEGIRPAIESALLAADAIAAADANHDRLEMYERSLQSRFGGRSAAFPNLPRGLINGLAPLLLRNRWFTRHVLLNRWFLHAHQQALPAM